MREVSDIRVPPYDQVAEQSVLGAILMNNEALREVIPIVKPEHFYLEANRRIYQTMIHMSSQGTPIDAVTLSASMSGDFEKVGGALAISKLTDAVATISNVTYYANIVLGLAARRAMIYAAQEIVAQGFSQAYETPEYLAQARKVVTLAASYLSGQSPGPRQIDDDLKEVLKEITSGKPPEGVIKTGFRGIDVTSGGMWPGFLHVLAARPGMGKSLAVLNIANNVSMRGEKVLYMILEDTRKLAVFRMFARYADIDLSDLTLGRVTEYEKFCALNEALARLSGKKPLWLDDTAGLTSDAIAQIAAAHKVKHGLDLLIIDHLHEVTDKGENETHITSHAASNFRNIAKDLNIPVLLVSQLNRETEGKYVKDRRPTLASLRQSGAIEQCARVIWFLYREAYYTKEEQRKDLEWIIAKANHGRTGMVKMWVNLSKMYCRDWDVSTDGLWPAEHEDVPIEKQASRDETY